MTTCGLPEAAFVVALLSLPHSTPGLVARLLGVRRSAGDAGTTLTQSRRSAVVVWERAVAGHLRVSLSRGGPDPDALARLWVAAGASMDLGRLWARYQAAGVLVDLLGDPGYPIELASHRDAPYVLFRVGAVPDLGGRRVAIIGTRRATPAGLDIAREFGHVLSQAGVRVVSGLALGIDGAAHTGVIAAVAAPPIGVVAGGLDWPYPSRHRFLWGEVASTGVLVSASTLGTPSQGWRFPARNHIIAALAEVVLVVESRETGGSMVTAELALERGAMVMAVPGSVRNPAAAGTNRLISEGAAPACDPADVLTALSLTPALGVSRRTLLDGADAPADADDGADAAVLDVLDDEPKTLAAVIERTGLPPGEVVAALTRLELQSRAITERGWWQRSRSGNRR